MSFLEILRSGSGNRNPCFNLGNAFHSAPNCSTWLFITFETTFPTSFQRPPFLCELWQCCRLKSAATAASPNNPVSRWFGFIFSLLIRSWWKWNENLNLKSMMESTTFLYLCFIIMRSKKRRKKRQMKDKKQKYSKQKYSKHKNDIDVRIDDVFSLRCRS